MRVKIIYSQSHLELETNLNTWLENQPHLEIEDIKIIPVPIYEPTWDAEKQQSNSVLTGYNLVAMILHSYQPINPKGS